MKRFPGKVGLIEQGLFWGLKLGPFPWISLQWVRVLFLFLVSRGDTQANGDVLCRCKFPLQIVTSTVSIASPVATVSQNNQFKITLKLRRHTLGWNSLVSYRVDWFILKQILHPNHEFLVFWKTTQIENSLRSSLFPSNTWAGKTSIPPRGSVHPQHSL